MKRDRTLTFGPENLRAVRYEKTVFGFTAIVPNTPPVLQLNISIRLTDCVLFATFNLGYMAMVYMIKGKPLYRLGFYEQLVC